MRNWLVAAHSSHLRRLESRVWCLMMWRAPDTRPVLATIRGQRTWGIPALSLVQSLHLCLLIGPQSPSLASDWLTSWQRLGCAEQRPGATNPCFNVHKNWPIDLISSEARLGCVRIIWIAHLHNVAADCRQSILFPQWLQSAYLYPIHFPLSYQMNWKCWAK